MTIKKTSFALMLMTMMCWQAPAWANYHCKGKITRLGFTTNGTLVVNNGYGNHLICNDIDDTSCKKWASLATTAKVTGRYLTIIYGDNTGRKVNADCHSIGGWVKPADPIEFVEIH